MSTTHRNRAVQDAARSRLPDSANGAASRVRQTALAELDLLLAGRGAPGRIEVSLLDESPTAQALARKGVIRLHLAPPDLDAFEVLEYDGTLLLIGSSPRGMLHAVFALEDALAAGRAMGEGLRLSGTFRFRQRIFHPRFAPWPGDRSDVRFIARMGASHALVSHDWQGSRRSLQGYVTSPVYPDAVDAAEVAANHAGLRRLLDDCADYGLGAMLWLTELPCQGGPWVPQEERERFLRRFPAEVLSDSGTYEGRVLCFGHPRVQEFYRDLLVRFFAAFPEIEMLFVFGLDSSGEFCDPALCPSCQGMSRIEQRDRLIRFLIKEGGCVRPGLRVLTTGWKWDRDAGEFLRHQAGLPAASGVFLAAEKDGWQCERQLHDFMRETRRVCQDQGQVFIGYDNLHWGDDTVHGIGDIQDFPLGVGAKIRRWRALDADGIFDHWGNSPEEIACNSIACRDFFLEPDADADVVCCRIAHRQFGVRAGGRVLAGWQALERAHRLLSPACTWAPGQWPGWYAGRRGYSPDPHTFPMEELNASRQPPRQEGGRICNPADLSDALQAVADAWRLAFPCYEEAARFLEEAHAIADDTPVFYRYWWKGDRPVPTCREHLRRQLLYVKSVGLAGREIGLQFGLYALWERAGRDLGAFRERAAGLLREDVEACRAAARHFRDIGKPDGWSAQYAAKAAAVEEWLGARGV